MRTADCAAADNLFREAFGITESRLEDLIRYLEIQPDGWFLAEHNRMPVGMVGAVNYGKTAYIGQLAVLPEYQKKGIGTALMQHALYWLDEQNVPSVLLDATEMGLPIYTRLGFTVVDTACVFAVEEPFSMAFRSERISKLIADDLIELADFDSYIFVGDRSRIFSTLARDFAESALIIRDETKRISGYLFIQGRKLGPWAASNPQDAESLLRAALAKGINGRPYAVVPGANLEAATLLRRYGFNAYKPHKFMVRGTIPKYHREKVYGQVSFALG